MASDCIKETITGCHTHTSSPLGHGCAHTPLIGVWIIAFYRFEASTSIATPNSIQPVDKVKSAQKICIMASTMLILKSPDVESYNTFGDDVVHCFSQLLERVSLLGPLCNFTFNAFQFILKISQLRIYDVRLMVDGKAL